MPKPEQYYKVYQAWVDMRYRCNNPKSKVYKSYGGRGISYSKEWNDYNVFRADMLPEYLKLVERGIEPRKIILGRINIEENYSKDNCRWMSPSELAQYQNSKNNYVVSKSPDGDVYLFPTLTEMAKFYGFSRNGASNALHSGRNYIFGVAFKRISKEDYNKGIENHEYAVSLLEE